MEKVCLTESHRGISAFLTFRCNLSCSYCVNKTNNKDFQRKGFREISGEEWVTALNRLESRKGVPVTFLGGEPFLHKNFIYIINNLKSELEIDILSNLWMGEEKLNEFIKNVSPERINRDAPYPSIRTSYHPEQMGDGERLIKNAKLLQDAGFNVGIESTMYPSPKHLEALERIAIKCRNNKSL